MRSLSLGHPTTVGALAAGACFAFDWHGQSFIGLKVFDDFAAQASAACAAIWPGHSDLGDGPTFLDGSFGPTTGVYELADAMIVPSTELGAWRIGTDLAGSAGVVVLARDRVLMGIARPNGKIAFVDLAAGRITPLPETTPLLHVSGWRLVQRVLDGYETICRFNTHADD
jgi:hypothetical protein